jgi:uroporphyrin-III C-methyltransferase/precorrin-2 dehydrogenase/sirohydrochlorin ferrochelatase
MSDTPRRPDERPTPRLSELASLPVFFRLGGRRVVLAGGSEGIAWKAELMAAAGAEVAVFAAAPSEALVALSRDVPRVRIIARGWTAGDLEGAALAIGDAQDEAEGRAFQSAARAAGVPVNVVDVPAFCDFQFGSIVERSPLVVAISTDGGAPVFGQELRARIETLLPEGFRAWAQAAKSWRPAVQALDLGFRARRSFWEAFTRLAFASPERLLTEADRDALLAAIATDAPATQRGSVVLVGAGPGDPELLTLKAVRALQSADVVLFDDLVAPQTVSMARREARKITVGKRGYKPSCTQEEITTMLVELAQAGQRVIRLKGGDPMIFGRANEELAGLRAAGVPVEIIPGVTSASAAAAALGLSLTERDVARRLQFITAHGRDGKLPTDLDWQALADPRATLVVYMGVRTLPELAARLTGAGLSPDTPAMMVEQASREDEKLTRSTLRDLPGLVAADRPNGPAIILIGAALRMA